MQWESVAPCLLVGSVAAMSVIQSDAARAQSSPTLFAATGTAATDSRADSGALEEILVTARKRSEICSAHRYRSPRSASRIWKTTGLFP